MRKHSQRVFLTICTVCILFIDLTAIIDLLNMGSQEYSLFVKISFVLSNLLLVAGWFFGKSRKTTKKLYKEVHRTKKFGALFIGKIHLQFVICGNTAAEQMEEMALGFLVEGMNSIGRHSLPAFQFTQKRKIHAGKGLFYFHMGKTFDFTYERFQHRCSDADSFLHIHTFPDIKENNMLNHCYSPPLQGQFPQRVLQGLQERTLQRLFPQLSLWPFQRLPFQQPSAF